MAELAFEKPEGCVAEASLSFSYQRLGGNQVVCTAEVLAVCAAQLGPWHDSTEYNNSLGGHKDRDRFQQSIASDLARLVVPFCAACPNNPKNKA